MNSPNTEDVRLNRIEAKLDEIGEYITKLRIEVAGLKIKSGVWGAIAGMIPAMGLFLLYIFKTMK